MRQQGLVMLEPRDVEIARLRAALAEVTEALKREVGHRKSTEERLATAEGELKLVADATPPAERDGAEATPERSEAKLRRVLAQLNEAQRLSKTGSYTADLAKEEHTWSDELYRIFDLDIGSPITVQKVLELVHPEDLQEFQSRLERASLGEASDFIFRITTPKGAVKYLRTLGKIEPTPGGGFELTGGVQDVTESKLAENALKTSEAELRRVLAQMNEAQRLSKTGSSTSDLASDEHIWSEELYRICGFEPGSKITTQRYFDIVHPDDRATLRSAIESALNGVDTADLMIRFVTPAGLKHIHLVANRMREFGDRPIFVGAVQDVTEATVAKEALAASERTLRETIDTIPVIVFGNEGPYAVNERWVEYTGVSKEAALSGSWQTTIHPDDLPQMMTAWTAMQKAGEGGEVEGRMRRADGMYRWFQFRTAALRDGAGNISWYGTANDIDDRKRADAELRRAYAHLTEAQRLSKSGSFTVDFVKNEHIWSDELYRICDLEPGTKFTPQDFLALVHPEDAQIVRTSVTDVTRGLGTDLIFRIITPKGTLKYLRGVGTSVEQVEGRFLTTGAMQDVTESKLAENALKKNEAELRRALEHLNDAQRLSKTGSFTIDLVKDEHVWSEELYRIFDFEPGSRITAQRVRESIVPEDRAAYETAIQRAFKTGEPEFECRIVTAGGAVRYLRAVAHRSEHSADHPEFVGAIQDVTESKLAEDALSKARAELAHVARVMTLSALTASIAHEVNQPLSGIITNASTSLRMLASEPPDLDGARTTAQRTIRDANRAADVIQRLRVMFARKQPRMETVDLNDAAREVLALSSRELQRAAVIVRTDLSYEVPSVRGDRVQLQQVILNMVLNAVDAMSEIEERPRELLIATRLEGGDQVRLSIQDSGVGIDPQDSQKIFQAFYTTKSSGMGIGLSISRSIIESHGGRLWAEPNNGPGATFSFSIPVDASA